MASNKVYIVCTSATREKLQMAAMIASVSVANGSVVSVFFSMNAILYFVRGRMDKMPIEGEFGNLLANKEVPEFKNLFKMAVELGDAQLLPCSMAVDVLGIKQDQLDPSFGPPTGLTKFLSDAEDGQLLHF